MSIELESYRIEPGNREPFASSSNVALGERSEADAALKKLIDEDADGAGSQIGKVYALRKELEKIFEWLEHAWTTHGSGVLELRRNPFLLAYKDDPRFIAFSQKIGVMPKDSR